MWRRQEVKKMRSEPADRSGSGRRGARTHVQPAVQKKSAKSRRGGAAGAAGAGARKRNAERGDVVWLLGSPERWGRRCLAAPPLARLADTLHALRPRRRRRRVCRPRRAASPCGCAAAGAAVELVRCVGSPPLLHLLQVFHQALPHLWVQRVAAAAQHAALGAPVDDARAHAGALQPGRRGAGRVGSARGGQACSGGSVICSKGGVRKLETSSTPMLRHLPSPWGAARPGAPAARRGP